MRAQQSCMKMAKLLTLQPRAINKGCNFTLDTKNQFLDPKLVRFGGLNVKIGLELTKLWQSPANPHTFFFAKLLHKPQPAFGTFSQ